MGKSASRTMVILAANVASLLESSRQSKADVARALKKDAKAINRILSAEHEAQTDTISALAAHFKKQPWELLHPDLGLAPQGESAPSISLALDTLIAAITALPQPARRALADDLALLAVAPGDAETKQRVGQALPPQQVQIDPDSGTAAAPELQEELDRLSREAEETHAHIAKRRRASGS